MGADGSRGQEVVSSTERQAIQYDRTKTDRNRASVNDRPGQDRHELPATIAVGEYHAYFHRNRHRANERPLRRVGGRDLDWLSTDQWLAYEVAVPEAGTYDLSLRVAAESAFGGGDVGVVLDDDPLARLTFDPTGGWYSWDEVGEELELPAGDHTLRLVVFDGGWKLEELTIE
jgi:hypothetical protein